jgi:hypothetical protein
MVVVGVNVPDDVELSVEHDVITTAPAMMTASRRIPPA